jgi:hypothetical protein
LFTMRKHYDGEALKERLEDTGLSNKEMIDSAEIGKSTFHRIIRPGVRPFSDGVWRLIRALEISEETIYPRNGFRAIDSAEFLTFFLANIDGVRIDVDPFESPDTVADPDNEKRHWRWAEFKRIANKLTVIIQNRANYSRSEWTKTIQDLWDEFKPLRINLSYIAYRYEHIGLEGNSQLFESVPEHHEQPVIRIIGQVFIHSEPWYRHLSAIKAQWTPDEWKSILFPDMFQSLKEQNPDRARPVVLWEEPGVSGVADRPRGK